MKTVRLENDIVFFLSYSCSFVVFQLLVMADEGGSTCNAFLSFCVLFLELIGSGGVHEKNRVVLKSNFCLERA